MARFVYRVFVWGTDGLRQRKDTELTLGDFLAKSREVYVKGQKIWYRIDMSEFFFFSDNFHGLERGEKDLCGMLVSVEGQIYFRWIEEGPWYSSGRILCIGAKIQDGWEGTGRATSNLARVPRRSTTKEAGASGCVHTQGIFCLLFTIRQVFC